MLDHQRSVQQRNFKPDKWREMEGIQRKQRIKQIYGNPQDITNRLMYFQESKPALIQMKSNSLNPSNSRRRLGSDQSIIYDDVKKIIPKSIIKDLRKNKQNIIDHSQTLIDQYNITYNSQPIEQVQNSQINQDTLMPLYQNKTASNNNLTDNESRQKQTIDQAKFTAIITPKNKTETSPNIRRESHSLLMDYLSNTKLISKQEYQLTTNQSITPTKGREDSIISKKRKKKKHKSKKNLQRFHSPNLQLLPSYTLGDKRVNNSVAGYIDYTRDKSPQLVEQYAGNTDSSISQINNESTQNLHQDQGQKKLSNFQGFDINLSPKNDNSKIKTSNMIVNNDKKEQINKSKLVLEQSPKDKQMKESCLLPSLNQNGNQSHPEMQQFRENVDRTLAPQNQYHLGFLIGPQQLKSHSSSNKLKARRDVRYNPNQSIIQRSKSPEIGNISSNLYKKYLNKSLVQESYSSQLQKDSYDLNGFKKSISSKIHNNMNNSDLNRSSDNRVSEILQQKYIHEVPNRLFQPIRKSYGTQQKLKGEESTLDFEVIDKQARDFSTSLLMEHSQQQQHLQQQYRKQMLHRYKTVQKNNISPLTRSPNLPTVNQNRYLPNSSIIMNNQYQYIVEQEPKFQIKVVPKYLINQRSDNKNASNNDLPEIIYMSPSRIIHKEQNSTQTKIYSQLQYSQSMINHKSTQQTYQNTLNPAQTEQGFNHSQAFISSQDHQQYLAQQINQQIKSSGSLQFQDDNVVIEKDCSPQRIQKSKSISKQSSPKINQNTRQSSNKNINEDKQEQQILKINLDGDGVSPNQNKKEENSRINSQRSSISGKNKNQQVLLRKNSKPSQGDEITPIKRLSTQEITQNKKSSPYLNSQRASFSGKKDQLEINRKNSKASSIKDKQNEIKENPVTDKQTQSKKDTNLDQKPPLRKQSTTTQKQNQADDTINKIVQNDKQVKDSIINKDKEDKVNVNSNVMDLKQNEVQKEDNKQSNQDQKQNNDSTTQQRKQSLKEKKPSLADVYSYQLNINYTQKEIEEIYNRFVEFTAKKRRDCCLEPFFQKAEHVIWVDNFQIKIDSSFQNQMLFKMRLGNQDEAKIYLKYEDTEITNQWNFTKLKDNLKCLPLKESEGIVLTGKNTKTSLKCFFSLVYLQSLKFESADLDYQYVNYSEELMKIIKSLCINNFFQNVLSKNDKNPCIQINNFPVFFPSYNTIAYENEEYMDIEEMNIISKRQNKLYNEQQVLRLIQDMLENIKKLHERNMTINNININNIVYSRETNTFKLLSYVHCELYEDNLTPRHSSEIELKYNQNSIYNTEKKLNQYKRDIYALGISVIIFKFQLTDYSINKGTIQEKIQIVKQNTSNSKANKILIELIEQEQLIRSSDVAKTYIEQFFNGQENNQIQRQKSIDAQQQNQNGSINSIQNINKSLGIGQKLISNIFEGYNLFEGIDQKQQSVSSNAQIQELQVLKKCFEHCGKINQFFSSYQSILDTSRQTYGLSSSIYLENLIDFYFEALHHNQKERIQTIIDFIEKENLFVFISQIPKSQQALRFMITTAFKFILENNLDKAMKYFDRALSLTNLTVQDLFQLNINLGILASQKQKKQKAILYLQQAQYISKSIHKQSVNLAAPYLLTGIINEDEKDLEIALQIKKDNGEDPQKVLNLLFKIGSLCLKKKNFTKGEEIFRTYMQSREDVTKETQKMKNQFFQAKLNLAFCMLGNKADHPILNVLIDDYLVELRQIYGQQSKETLYALYEISEVLINLKVDVKEVIPVYVQCKQIATLINENQLINELEAKLEKLNTPPK